MKKYFTPVIIASAMLAATSISAEKPAHSFLQAKQKTSITKETRQTTLLSSLRKAAEGNLLKPTKQAIYMYEDGEWILDMNVTLAYDSHGNITTITREEAEEGTLMRTEYTYDKYDNCISEVTSISEDGVNWTPGEKRSREYNDPVLHNLMTLNEGFYYSGSDWDIIYGNKFEVTRNSDNNITAYNVMVLFNNAYDTTVKTVMTYPDGKKEPDTWTVQNLDYDYNTAEYFWKEGTKLQEIVWESCDGQIATTDFSRLFSGENKIKRAQISDGGEEAAVLQAEYPNEKDYIITSTYSEDGMTMTETMSLTHTDDNGSYIERTTAEYSYDDDPENTVSEGESYEIICDDHGNITSEISKFFEGDYEELIGQINYDYTYGENGETLEAITSEYDFDTEDFMPIDKIVSSEFVKISAGIDQAISSQAISCSVNDNCLNVAAPGEASVKVYSATGINVISTSGNGSFDIDLSSLAGGVYVASVSCEAGVKTLKFAK